MTCVSEMQEGCDFEEVVKRLQIQSDIALSLVEFKSSLSFHNVIFPGPY